MGSHRTPKAWQHAKILAVDCVRAAQGFPPQEQTALADQLRRAAYSAALNIAEGAGRKGAREFRRFVGCARASLDEVEAILEIARELGYVGSSAFARLEARRDEAAKTLYGLPLPPVRCAPPRVCASGHYRSPDPCGPVATVPCVYFLGPRRIRAGSGLP